MKHSVIALAILVASGVATAPVLVEAASSKAEKSGFPTSQAGYEAQHTMTGTVASLDRKTGMLGLKTDEGSLALQFPPAKIHNIKEGERVTVELGVKPETSPSASPSSMSTSRSKK